MLVLVFVPVLVPVLVLVLVPVLVPVLDLALVVVEPDVSAVAFTDGEVP